MKLVIIVIDMLHEFVRGRLRSPEAESIIPVIRDIVEKARAKKIPVIYVADQHLPYDYELKIWGPHAMFNSVESKIVDDLKPLSQDIVLYKRSYSGFRDTGLDNILRSMNIDTVVLTGIHTHICVLHTAWDAFYHGYKIIIVKNAVAAFNREDHDYALKFMEKIYGARVIDSNQLLSILEKEVEV